MCSWCKSSELQIRLGAQLSARSRPLPARRPFSCHPRRAAAEGREAKAAGESNKRFDSDSDDEGERGALARRTRCSPLDASLHVFALKASHTFYGLPNPCTRHENTPTPSPLRTPCPSQTAGLRPAAARATAAARPATTRAATTTARRRASWRAATKRTTPLRTPRRTSDELSEASGPRRGRRQRGSLRPAAPGGAAAFRSLLAPALPTAGGGAAAAPCVAPGPPPSAWAGARCRP